MKPKHKRFVSTLFFLACIFIGGSIIIQNFSENLIYFYSPSDLEEAKINKPNVFEKILSKKIRAGGLVKEGSLKSIKNGQFTFLVTDKKNEIAIHYQGILPPIFREGQGVVAEGRIKNEGTNKTIEFNALKLVTKHDENYMPPEVKKSLKDN